MNRSYRAQESRMQPAAEKQRQQLRDSMLKEKVHKEEELALFLEMKKRDKKQSYLLLHNSEEFDAPLGSRSGTSPIFNISPPTITRKIGNDDFLDSENDKNDYDWLLTPPGTPLFPSLEVESQKTVMSQFGNPNTRPVVMKSRLASPQLEPVARNNSPVSKPLISQGMNSPSGGIRTLSSPGGSGSRPGTPTGRPPRTTTTTRPSTPTSRASLPSNRPSLTPSRSLVTAPRSTTPATKSKAPVARSTTPLTKPVTVTRSTAPLTKPTTVTRPTTPLSRSTAKSAPPTSRPSIPPQKSTSRAATPTRRPSTPANAPVVSAPRVKSPAVAKPSLVPSRNLPSRGTSPTVRSQPWKPLNMPGFSLDTPPNLRTSVPERPLSASRGRPGAPSSRSSSVEPGGTGRPRRQSCSPSRGRAPNGVMMHASGSSVPAVSRGYSKSNDHASPAMMGTKMVERVISMRKLAPPKLDDKNNSPRGTLSVKSSSPDSSGFGRTLSKKSLDMAIRHMDIRRSIPNNLRPLMTNIPASSMYSVRSGHTRSRTVSVSDSPLATSSNASSEMSVNNNGIYLSEQEDEFVSERSSRSPASMQPR